MRPEYRLMPKTARTATKTRDPKLMARTLLIEKSRRFLVLLVAMGLLPLVFFCCSIYNIICGLPMGGDKICALDHIIIRRCAGLDKVLVFKY